jgi:type IV pilus biogenesis protein PilP
MDMTEAELKAYYHRSDALRSATEMANLELAYLEAQHTLELARQGIFKSDTNAAPAQTNMTVAPMVPTAPLPDSAATSGTRLASVEQTSMVDGRWIAEIRLPSGGYLNKAQAGQSIPGVGKILNVSQNDVTVTDGKKTYSLPFASDDSSSSSASAMMASHNGFNGLIAPPIGIH